MIKFNRDDIFLVTGASSGIGRAISIKIIELGGTVIGVARNQQRLEETKQLISDSKAFNVEIKDLVQDIDALPNWIKTIVEKYGKLKGLVLSAGIQYTLPLQADKVEKAKDLFDINFFTNLSLIKGFIKKNNNIGQGSSIVAISSFTSLIGVPATASYSASKAALNSLARTLAVEVARDGLRINTISAGHILTEMLLQEGKFSENQLENLKQKYPLGLGKPEDVANTCCFLLSDAARWITGANIVVDGGISISF